VSQTVKVTDCTKSGPATPGVRTSNLVITVSGTGKLSWVSGEEPGHARVLSHRR
jgi:hypothetical protein